MGYSERDCHICGVSFNIGRIRTKDEPRSNAWHQLRQKDNRCFVDSSRNSHIGECGRDAGCMLAFREDMAEELETRQKQHNIDSGSKRDGDCGFADEAEADNETDDRYDEDFVPDDMVMQKLRIDEEYAKNGAFSPQGPTTSIQIAVNRAEIFSYDPMMHHNESVSDVVSDDDHVIDDIEYDSPMETCSENEDQHADTRMTSVSDSDDESVALYRDFVDGLEPRVPAKSIRDDEELILPLFRSLADRDDDMASTDGSDASFECDKEEGSHEWNAQRLDHRISGKLSHYRHPLSKTYSRHCRDSIWEHIAGPGCMNTNGYNGTRISEEEMQYANTLQCLVRKLNGGCGNHKISALSDWQSEWDDEPWEQDSSWFLSGISDYMPSRDCDDPQVFPQRHGCDRPNAENVCWSRPTDDSEQYAMPFHPSCFEIYRRAAIERHGHFNVDLLGSWYQLKSRYSEFHSFPRSEAVKKGERQWWQHNPGDEYLAADPLWPSGLREAITSAKFERPRVENNESASSRWGSLPLEVTVLVLSHLDTVAIAKISLAIPETRSIARRVMQRRLQVEYPHLWELSSTQSYYKWTGLTANELKTRQKRLDQKEAEFRLIYSILDEEGHGEARDQLKQNWAESNKATQNELLGSAIMEKLPLTVPTDEVDIARFVLALHDAEEVGNLKGLHNRGRIWKDCETILDQIEELKDQGDIEPDGQPRPGAQLFEH